jgi:hypothetical protein
MGPPNWIGYLIIFLAINHEKLLFFYFYEDFFYEASKWDRLAHNFPCHQPREIIVFLFL